MLRDGSSDSDPADGGKRGAAVKTWKRMVENLKLMKGMSFSQKLDHLWTYYRFHILGLVLFLVIAGAILHAAFGPHRETVFSVMLVDAGGDEAVVAETFDSFLSSLDLDEKTQAASYTTASVLGDNGVQSLQMLVMNVISGEVDAFFCRRDVANYLLKSGALCDLQEIMPQEVMAAWADRLIYVDAAALAKWTEASNEGDFTDADLLLESPEGLEQPVAVAFDVTEACVAAFGRSVDEGALYFAPSVTTVHEDVLVRFLNTLG